MYHYQLKLCWGNLLSLLITILFESSMKRSHRDIVYLVACACVADVSFPFSRHGDQASEGENEFLASKKWEEVGRGEQNKKGEWRESGQERN